jgi:hypothetical protein
LVIGGALIGSSLGVDDSVEFRVVVGYMVYVFVAGISVLDTWGMLYNVGIVYVKLN